jgi:hypothetical protein
MITGRQRALSLSLAALALGACAHSSAGRPGRAVLVQEGDGYPANNDPWLAAGKVRAAPFSLKAALQRCVLIAA